MLSCLRNIQTGEDTRLHNVPIYLFGEVKHVDLLCPIFFVSADTPAAEKLSAHYSNFACIIQWPTTACDVTVEELDNQNHACNFVEWDALNDIAMNGTEQEQQSASQHQCQNAFSDIIIGHPTYQFFGALPMDLMHSVQKALIGCCMEILFKCMTEMKKNKLDLLAKNFMQLIIKLHAITSLELISAMALPSCL